MAKYTLDEIMYGGKYGNESAMLAEGFRMAGQKLDVKVIRERIILV